jgi:hypothetical protein
MLIDFATGARPTALDQAQTRNITVVSNYLRNFNRPSGNLTDLNENYGFVLPSQLTTASNGLTPLGIAMPPRYESAPGEDCIREARNPGWRAPRNDDDTPFDNPNGEAQGLITDRPLLALGQTVSDACGVVACSRGGGVILACTNKQQYLVRVVPDAIAAFAGYNVDVSDIFVHIGPGVQAHPLDETRKAAVIKEFPIAAGEDPYTGRRFFTEPAHLADREDGRVHALNLAALTRWYWLKVGGIDPTQLSFDDRDTMTTSGFPSRDSAVAAGLYRPVVLGTPTTIDTGEGSWRSGAFAIMKNG